MREGSRLAFEGQQCKTAATKAAALHIHRQVVQTSSNHTARQRQPTAACSRGRSTGSSSLPLPAPPALACSIFSFAKRYASAISGLAGTRGGSRPEGRARGDGGERRRSLSRSRPSLRSPRSSPRSWPRLRGRRERAGDQPAAVHASPAPGLQLRPCTRLLRDLRVFTCHESRPAASA